MGEYKVFKVETGWEIFWCPSAPMHYNDKIPYDGRIYPQRAGAYRRVKQLNNELEKLSQDEKKESVA